MLLTGSELPMGGIICSLLYPSGPDTHLYTAGVSIKMSVCALCPEMYTLTTVAKHAMASQKLLERTCNVYCMTDLKATRSVPCKSVSQISSQR